MLAVISDTVWLGIITGIGGFIALFLKLLFSKVENVHILVNSQSVKQDNVIQTLRTANDALRSALDQHSKANNDLNRIVDHLERRTQLVLGPTPTSTAPLPVTVVSAIPIPVLVQNAKSMGTQQVEIVNTDPVKVNVQNPPDIHGTPEDPVSVTVIQDKPVPVKIHPDDKAEKL